MMQEMTNAQIAEHKAKMERSREAMPPDVRECINRLADYVDAAQFWDDAVDTREAITWWIDSAVDWTKPCKPLSPSREQ